MHFFYLEIITCDPRYVEKITISLLYLTRRVNSLVHKGLILVP